MAAKEKRSPGRLIDRTGIMDHYGVTRHVAEEWFRQLPKIVHPGGVKKLYVYTRDVEQLVRDAEMAP